MTYIDLLLITAVALVTGTVAQLTSGYSKGGWIVNLVIGFIGAMAGVHFSRLLDAPLLYNLQVGAVTFPIIYCLIGAVIFLAAIGLAIKPGRN